MAKEQYKYVEVQIPATPRNKRLTDSIQAAAQTGSGGGIGYPSTPQYWELATVKEDGTVLEESQYYLRPISGKHVVVPGDVVAFADGGEYASGLPVADYNTFGLFKAKQGGGLLFDVNEGWYVDPEFAGGGGIDEEQLKQYLTDNNYITVDYLTKQGYLTLSSQLTGYTKPDAYSPIAATDTILSAIGKLERNFDNYVDLTTNQTIGGVKTFNETILSKKDVIAYADDGEYASGLPVADTVTYGLVKVDGTTVRINASGQLEAESGGGIDFEVGTGLQMSASSVLSVKYGTTAGTACQGDDSRLSNARRNPYYLSWSGYNTGSYDGSASESFEIPNNTSQLINGAGFIKDGNGNFTTLANSGSSSQYLAGNGRFYTISHSEIDGLSSNYVTLNTQQIVTGLKTFRPGIRSGNPDTDLGIVTSSGNSINGMDKGVIGNLYLNYQGSNAFSRVDKNNNIITTGDIVAFSDGGTYASGLPVADQYTYGLIKYDGTTIGKNSSGQLYVINAGSGGGSNINVIDSLTSQSKTDALSANQGYQLDQRLKNVRWATPDGTDYVRVYLGSEYRDLSKNGHSHAWSTIASKPSWIGSTKPSYSWSEITNKPTVISSITYSTSGSGNAVTNVTASGNTVYVTKGNISGGDGGAASELTSYVTTPYSGTIFRRSGNNLGIKVSGGNSLNGYDSSQTNDIGNLYLNYVSGSINVRISNEGKIYSNGSQVTSDLRLKAIIGYENEVLDRMLMIPVIHYIRKDIPNSGLTTGFGAQNFIGVFDNVTFINPDSGYYGINEGAILGIAFQGVKELYTRFLPVENKVKTLESRVQNLQLRLDNAYREIFELKQQMGGAA